MSDGRRERLGVEQAGTPGVRLQPDLAPGLAPVRAVLPNGLRVIAKESRTTPAVTIHLAVEAGSIFDPPLQAGVAHFVSRTIDRGTLSRSADQVAEELDSRAVSLNVSVNRHALFLVCTCLVEDFRFILSLLAEMVMHPAFAVDEVATRRGEIVTMIRQDEDSPAVVANETLMATLYGANHPYGRRPRGSVADVERIDAATLQAFHASRFLPPAVSLVIVGDVPPQHAIDTAADAFGGWSPSAVLDRPPLPAPAAASGRRRRVVPMMNKAQADIAYGFISILRSDPSFQAYSLMNNILGQYSIGGRLGDSIREQQGMAYYAFSSLDANVIAGPLVIRAGVSPANVDRAIASIDAELARMAADGPTDREMAESTQYMIGSMPRTLETNGGIATFLQTAEFFGLGLDYDLRLPGLLRAVHRDDVHAAAQRLLDPSNAAVVVAGPYEDAVEAGR